MTLSETTRSLYDLSVAGFFNGEKFTYPQIHRYIRNLLTNGTPKLGNKIVIQIALPDGWWYMSVIRFNNQPDGYSYYIPETREDEAHLIQELVS